MQAGENMIYSDIMGTYDGEDTTFTDLDSGYSPLTSGRLVQVKAYWSQTAATSVMAALTFKLTNAKWGVPLHVTIQGAGIATAPAFPPIPGVQNCDLPVVIGSDITIQARHEAGITAVTSNATLIGVFEG